MSSFVNSNCTQLNRRVYIDLAQYLLRQYLVNDSDSSDSFLYAESFDPQSFKGVDMLINQDSFPEIPEKSLMNYFSIISDSKVKYIISYNQETDVSGHSDFRSLIMEYGMLSAFRFCSVLRPGYVIELFYHPGLIFRSSCGT